MSSASKPATTAGRPYSSGRNLKCSAPVTTATCPGQRKPCTSKPSEPMSARSAGSTNLNMGNTE